MSETSGIQMSQNSDSFLDVEAKVDLYYKVGHHCVRLAICDRFVAAL